MADRVSRSRFVAGAATSAFASIAIVRSPARAAQFDYKMAHGTPTNMAVHVRSAEMWDAVKRETKGAINVKIFPNNELGSELAQLSQLRSGALQFMIIQGVSLSGVVPGVSMPPSNTLYNIRSSDYAKSYVPFVKDWHAMFAH